MVIWITGLSGAGKTTIGKEVYHILKEESPSTVLLDGDEVRELFRLQRLKNPYSHESRRLIGQNYHQLCKWLDRQQINVVCCTICSYPEIREQNRSELRNYHEVFVDVPICVLVERDDKDLYQPAIRGETKDVVGIDLDYDAPQSPDMIIDNSQFNVDPRILASRILKRIGGSKDESLLTHLDE